MGERISPGAHYYYYDDLSFAYLPQIVTDWLGLNSDYGRYIKYKGILDSLTNRNDSEDSFEQIADLIESEPEELFK